MADNYLEKRYEEVFGKGKAAGAASPLTGRTLDALLLHNRKVGGFKTDYKVHSLQMEAILSVVPKLAGLIDVDGLSLFPVCDGQLANAVLENVKFEVGENGGAPQAFVVICEATDANGNAGDNVDLFVNLGMLLQSMLLKAVEIGLNGLVIRDFDSAALNRALQLPSAPLAVLAIGKAAD